MPPTKPLTFAVLLAATVTIAGCNSTKTASSAVTGTATTAAAAAASSAAAAIESAAAAASAPAVASASAASGATGTSAGGCPLTAAQVTTTMGAAYAAPTSAYGICTYVSTASGNALTIQVLDGTPPDDFAGTLATAVQDNGTDTTTAIPGLGSKATGVGLEIVVQSGSKIIDIRSADSPGFGSWPKSIALANLVIAGLH